MYVDELQTRESLVRMARRITSNVTLREDLLQEALIHLWLTERRRPGQTRSWYLQSCKYHLLHYLASGRSVDSTKRRAGQMLMETNLERGEDLFEQGDDGDSVLTWVSARDIISMLSPQLSSNERSVLNCFADGLGPREIGRKLSMSHTMVIKHRRKIASLFERLDLPVVERNQTVVMSNDLKRQNGEARKGAPVSRQNGSSGLTIEQPATNGGRFKQTDAMSQWRRAGRQDSLVTAG